MNRVITALFALCVGLTAARAQDDDIMNKLVNVPSPKSWATQGLTQFPAVIDDKDVQGGQAVRIAVPEKGDNPWSVQATSAIVKPVKAGDVILVAFWARSEVPAEGQNTAIVSSIRVQELKAPYGTFAQESAAVTSKWGMYYASGVADKDYKPGVLGAVLHLGAAKQTIDLGPVFVLDFGPDYDQKKLPHNKTAPAVPAAAPAAPAGPPPVTNASAEQRFSAELVKIRAMLPVPGALINDPAVSTVGTYGPDQSGQIVAAPEIAGGQALRVRIEKAQPQMYGAGTSSPLTGAIRKGDTVVIAFYARAADEAQGAVISSLQAELKQEPYTPALQARITVPKNTWQLFLFSGVAQADLPVGAGMLSAQIGDIKQTIDFGPAFVLNLGPGVNPAALPKDKVN